MAPAPIPPKPTKNFNSRFEALREPDALALVNKLNRYSKIRVIGILQKGADFVCFIEHL